MQIRFVLAVVLSVLGTASAVRAEPQEMPTLYAIGKTSPQSYARGAQKAWPVSVDEAGAFSAIFRGGMWLPSPEGGRQFVRYDHHVVHQAGDWTFFGKVRTARGEQSAIITFGKSAVFGYIPQEHGQALRITSNGRQTLLVQTAGTMQRSPFAENLEATPDFGVPPHTRAPTPRSSAGASQSLAEQTGASPTVDLMIAYTPGFVSEYGSQSAALTRLDYVVDVANQAYADSGIGGRVRLVHAVEVNYPDDTYDPDAVSDLTGISITTGQPVPIPASLSQIHSLRTQYGADLVSMIRKYDDATNGYCGFAWIIGADQSPIVPSSDSAYGYSVVGDGSDNGYYCYDQALAHELGHNMGSVHDRAHPSLDSHGNPISGAYPYSYGYAGGSSPGFFTIMAYGSGTQTPAGVFSSPNISLCQGQPCGVANQEDNVRSLNQTMPLIAQFEAVPMTKAPPNDVDGDGKSDLLWSLPTGPQFGYWIMNGSSVTRSQVFNAMSGYHVAATGDFNGDGIVDLAWTNGSAVYEWIGNGTGYSSQLVGYYDSRWRLVGAADIDGDGKADLLWHSTQLSSFAFWIMNGTTVVRAASLPVASTLRFAGSGDFDGDGKADIVWTDSRSVYLWLGNGSQFTSKLAGAYGTGWKLVGVGDIDGDGQSDLLFSNRGASSFAYWLMRNGYPVNSASFPVGSQYWVGAIGDFDGNGKTDVMWTDGAALYEWKGNGVGFAGSYVANYGGGWSLVQTGEPP